MTTENAAENPKRKAPKKAQSGWHPTTKRWWSIILLAVFGAAIVITLRLLIPTPFESAIAALAALTPKGRAVAYFVFAAVLGHMVWSLSRFSGSCQRLSFRTFMSYPPTWFAGVLGAGIYMIYIFWPDIRIIPTCREFSEGWWSLLAFPVGFICDAVIACIKRRLWGRMESSESYDLHDRPISTPDEDKYEMKPIAVRLLAAVSSSPPKSVVLDGPFGSGKSSVVNLLAYYLENPPTEDTGGQKAENQTKDVRIPESRIRLTTIRGWGLSDDNVVTHVLEELVRAIAEHVDATPISRLPAQYNTIVAKAHSLGEMIASALSVSTTPESLIESADDMLEAVDLYLVLAIEDMDRNWSEDIWPSLGALLERFRLARRISHILSIDGRHVESVDAPFVHRVSELRITMPAMPIDLVIEKIRSWWKKNEALYSDNILPRSRDRERTLYSTDADTVHNLLGDGPMQALAECLSTPRLLNRTMGETEASWKLLRGEVDIHDLFILKAIHNTEPKVYQFIRHHISDLQLAESHAGEDKYIAASAEQRIDKAWKEIASFGKRYEVLLDFLFPNRHENTEVASERGICVHQPANYAERYFRETL